ncbi:MAG: hypothetical protein M3177_03410 [Pseudomonadota bacterium]|nr:hypothetical protein [Pseudomonadota bacterium]
MFSLFGPRLPIDADELEFQLATFKWLQQQFGAVGDAPLVLPTPEFFPSVRNGRADPRELFDDVRRAAGMEEWPCRLEAGAAERPIDAGNAHLLRHEGAPPPCGTFRVEEANGGRQAVITYNPSMTDDPVGLAATFAHELGHYLMATSSGTPPGGWDLHELHTDILAVYLGFGIFLANSARNFSQFQSGGQSGWSSRWQGYLSEGALVTALVIRERLAGREAAAAAPFLKDYLRSDLRKADAALRKLHPDLARAVAAVDLAEYGSA